MFNLRRNVKGVSVSEVNHLIASDTDRAVALIGAAFLENQLEKIIRKMLVKDINIDLFSHGEAAGTFSSKIRLSYALGLINKDIYNELNMIRKIRNSFAHDFSDLTFETEMKGNNIRSLTNNLNAGKLLVKAIDQSEDEMIESYKKNGKSSGRMHFELSVILVSFYLDTALKLVRTPTGRENGISGIARRVPRKQKT